MRRGPFSRLRYSRETDIEAILPWKNIRLSGFSRLNEAYWSNMAIRQFLSACCTIRWPGSKTGATLPALNQSREHHHTARERKTLPDALLHRPSQRRDKRCGAGELRRRRGRATARSGGLILALNRRVVDPDVLLRIAGGGTQVIPDAARGQRDRAAHAMAATTVNAPCSNTVRLLATQSVTFV